MGRLCSGSLKDLAVYSLGCTPQVACWLERSIVMSALHKITLTLPAARQTEPSLSQAEPQVPTQNTAG